MPPPPPAAERTVQGVPSPAAVLRRALFVWGAGHLALGDRRGWLLVIAQIVAIASLAVVTALLIETSRWLIVLVALVIVLVAWLGQAVDAFRRALAAGGAPGGALQVVALLPLGVLLLGGFWLVGGDLGSPGATLQRYVSAWQSDRPASAATLLDEVADADTLSAEWQVQREQLRVLVAAAAARYGGQAGLDAGVPFNSLRFEEVAAERDGGRAVVAVDLVRRERFQTQLFGVIPTAAQRTVSVRQLGVIRLRAEPAPAPWWLPAGLGVPARVWLIDEVALDLQP